MRIRGVRAVAFGSLQEQDLNLADGMTVIYGPNEAGKSTWHAAIHAALGRNAPLTPLHNAPQHQSQSLVQPVQTLDARIIVFVARLHVALPQPAARTSLDNSDPRDAHSLFPYHRSSRWGDCLR